jgi:hypothetical protein
MIVVKSVCLAIAGCVLAQGVIHRCPAQDGICETLGEPLHVHDEIPTGGNFTVRASAVQVSNAGPGSFNLNLTDNLAFWQDRVVANLR